MQKGFSNGLHNGFGAGKPMHTLRKMHCPEKNLCPESSSDCFHRLPAP